MATMAQLIRYTLQITAEDIIKGKSFISRISEPHPERYPTAFLKLPPKIRLDSDSTIYKIGAALRQYRSDVSDLANDPYSYTVSMWWEPGVSRTRVSVGKDGYNFITYWNFEIWDPEMIGWGMENSIQNRNNK